MPHVVMLTSLAGPSQTGPSIDIVPGDRADCQESTAISLLAAGFARELCLEGTDDKRPLKWLDNPATHPTDPIEPADQPTSSTTTQQPSNTKRKPPNKKRKPQTKVNTDANQDAPKSAQA